MKQVELYFGYTKGNYQTWDTDYFDIPGEVYHGYLLGQDMSQEYTKVYIKEQKKRNLPSIVFIGMYNENGDNNENN